MLANTTVIRTWQDAAEQLRQAKRKAAEEGHLMTPYELYQTNELLTRSRDMLRGVIETGAVSDFGAAVTAYRDAHQTVKTARQREINSYDAARLNNEMSMTSQRMTVALRSPDPVPMLQAIMREARDSGDKHKQRATYEIVQGAIDQSGNISNEDTRRFINRVSVEARDLLAGLRNTREFNDAVTKAEGAFDVMVSKWRGLNDIAELLGDLHPGAQGGPYAGPIGAAYRRVQGDGQGHLLVDGEA